VAVDDRRLEAEGDDGMNVLQSFEDPSIFGMDSLAGSVDVRSGSAS
jgi:hypothetical protein